jgi:hypothetical protein
MDACCDGRGEFFDRSENLDWTNQDLPTGQIDCGNIIFSGKCIMNAYWSLFVICSKDKSSRRRRHEQRDMEVCPESFGLHR